MAIIKIPSGNIFSVENTAMTKSNIITQATIEMSNFQKEIGNVLNQEYEIVFWEYDEDADEYIYVGNDANINTITFTKVKSTNSFGETEYRAVASNPPIYFNVDKPYISVVTDSNEVVTNYWMSRNTTYGKNGESTEDIVESENSLKYDPNKNAFSWYLGKGEDYNLIIQSPDNTYLMREKISVIGSYFAPQKSLYSYGIAEKNKFSLSSNELVQYGNTTNGLPAQEEILSKVVEQYSNGKEVLRIKCSLGEYYDIDDELIVSPYIENLPSHIEKYDIVEPYVFTSRGEVPLSTYSNGEAMRFEVTGVDFSYKGVAWQELTLQEYVE